MELGAIQGETIAAQDEKEEDHVGVMTFGQLACRVGGIVVATTVVLVCVFTLRDDKGGEAAPTLAKLHAQIAAAEGDSARAETAEQQRRQAEADLKAAEAQLVAALGKKKEALASVAELEGKMVAHEVSMAKLRAEPPEPSVEDLERWNQEIRAAIEKVLGSADAEEVIEVLESAAHALGALTVGQM